jgi:hypothetical protein
VGSEGNKSPFDEVRRMMITMLDELKVELEEDYKNNPMNPKRTHKELQEIQKQVNEIKEINKL